MPAKRTLAVTTPNISPRNGLPSTDHAVVDAVLKELKQCTRRLQTAFEMLHIELQVLEKLYYKGNNQHRTALFWRRVSYIRRFGRRLEGADIYGLVEGVRLSFWGSEAKSNSKVLKGPWICYPDAKTIQTILRRSMDCHTLVRQMHEGTTKAHNHFNLEFQGGAFLQLILTLTAISSRVSMLLTEEIRPAIEQSCRVLYKLLHSVLHADIDRSAPSWMASLPAPAPSLAASIKGSLSARTSEGAETPARVLDVDEDIGMTVPTATFATPTTVSTPRSATPVITNAHATEFTFASSKTRVTQSTIVRASTPKEGPSDTPGAKRKQPSKRASGDASTTLKKKKKKKDEIDDIFGF